MLHFHLVWCTKQKLAWPRIFFATNIFFLTNFGKFTEKHFCQRLSFNKVADLLAGTLLRKRLRHSSFPTNFAQLFRVSIYRKPPSYCFYSKYMYIYIYIYIYICLYILYKLYMYICIYNIKIYILFNICYI